MGVPLTPPWKLPTTIQMNASRPSSQCAFASTHIGKSRPLSAGDPVCSPQSFTSHETQASAPTAFQNQRSSRISVCVLSISRTEMCWIALMMR
jgi:hypothetical protein